MPTRMRQAMSRTIGLDPKGRLSVVREEPDPKYINVTFPLELVHVLC